MEDEDEWDLATIHELDRIAEAAVAAKRSTQAAAAVSTPQKSSLDAWDAAGAMLSQSVQLSRQRSPMAKTKSQQQEIDRLTAELCFKDQEIMDARRACLEKDAELKKAVASASALQDEIKSVKRAINNPAKTKKAAVAPEPSPVSKARTSESFRAGPSTGTSQVPLRRALHDPTHDIERSCRQQRIWYPENHTEDAQLLGHLLATCGTELYTLQTSCRGSELHEALAAVSGGCRAPHTLINSLFSFSKSQEMNIVRCSLRVLGCLLQHDGRLCFGCDMEMHQESEVRGDKWALRTTESPSGRGNPLPVFSSTRIVPRSEGGNRAPSDSVSPEALTKFVDWILGLAVNTKDRAVKFEALSVISALLLQAGRRILIGSIVLKGDLASLLNKEAGIDVQVSVARMSFLLFNCPEFLAKLCPSDQEPNDVCKGLLKALSACLTQTGRTAQNCTLREYALQALGIVLRASKNGATVLGSTMLAVQLITFIDYEFLLNEIHFDDERLSMLQEAVSMLYQLGVHPVHSAAVLASLVSDAVTCRRSMHVVNSLVMLGSRLRPGRKSCTTDLGSMAKRLKSKLLASLSNTSEDPAAILC